MQFIGFPLSAIIYMTIFLTTHFSKKRVNIFENKLLVGIMFLNLIGLILELGCYYVVISNYVTTWLQIFILKTYVVYIATFNFALNIYLMILTNKNYGKIEFDVFNTFKKNLILSIIPYLIMVGLIYKLPIYLFDENNYYYTYGPSINILFALSVVQIGLWITRSFILRLKTKNKSKQQFAILIAVILFGTILTLVQFIDKRVLILTSMHTMVLVIMYCFIENPDVKMVDELIENRRIIERTSEEKSVFLFKMSQGLREQVNNIDKQVDLYKEGNLNNEEKDLVIENIDKNNKKINYLINDVLGINSFDNSNIKKIEATYNIYSLLEDIKRRGKSYIKGDIDYKFTMVDNMPKELYGDSIKLKQVLMSLLINALENTKEGFVYVDVDSFTKYDICRIVITVEDSGNGIDITTINDILDQDLELTEKDYLKIEKLDVDLPLAYKMIKMLGGTMYIKSEPKKGTEIIITIDQYIVMNEEIRNNSQVDNYLKTRKNIKKILLVNDDEKEIRKIKKVLEHKDYGVVISMFGQDVIDRIRNKEKYDVILIDDEMPLMNGINVLDELVKLKNKSKKIILLEKDKLFIADHYVKDGFDDYIDKSNLIKELDKKIK